MINWHQFYSRLFQIFKYVFITQQGSYKLLGILKRKPPYSEVENKGQDTRLNDGYYIDIDTPF